MEPMKLSIAYNALDKGAFVPPHTLRYVDNEGWTLVHYAAVFNNLRMVKTLFNLGIAVGVRSHTGQTPADCARNMGHAELALYLDGCAQHQAAAEDTLRLVERPAAAAPLPKKRGLSRLISWSRWHAPDWGVGFGRYDGAFEAHLGHNILRFAPEGN